ncbi:diguanylate cyclase [Dokdonella sp.]|uniref:GGDEF domain-containing protein n=1 Tax=Dokdonella sp. TaxID=2291710 RepID=UPI001B194BC2|nr:diguanylate cyclase [Dokdonella sp.]MBO9664066.1 diguanylate cyclase [Dokdonella sp.]
MALLFALCAHAMAAVAASPTPTLRIAALPPAVEADIASLRAGEHDGELSALTGTTPTMTSGSGQWLRVSLDADWHAATPPVLSIRDANLTEIQVYAPPAYEAQVLLHNRADAQARFSRHALVSVLSPDLRAGEPIWVRIGETKTRKSLHFELDDLATYQAKDLRHVRIATLFASVQLAMILVGLCLWLALRDRLFAYFVGYSSVQLVYQTLGSGELYDVVGGVALAPLGTHASWITAVLSAALAISFILEFCDLQRQTPRLARALGAFRWPFLLVVPLILFGDDRLDRWLPPALNVLLLLSALLAIADVMLVAWRGNRAARFFVVAWLPQVAFTALRVGQLLLGWPQPPWIEYGFPFTMAFSSIVLILGLADDTLRVRRERDFAHHLASHDGLTGALNRRALLARLADAVVQARERSSPLALLFLDIDHFKSINDEHGHPVGDACLKAVADRVAALLRLPQVLGRYGGEEFVALLPGSSRERAAEIGERLRHAVEALHVDAGGTPLRLTVSIGVAALDSADGSPETLIADADRAVYQAKSSGRNRVCVHPPSAVPRAA